jgi:hypothetical protein
MLNKKRWFQYQVLMEADPPAVDRRPAGLAGIVIPARYMGSKDPGQGAVSVLVMSEAEGIGIYSGKPVCPVGHAGGQMGRVRARIANPATHGKTEPECSKKNLAQLIFKLDERGREEIAEIELALIKMSSGMKKYLSTIKTEENYSMPREGQHV